MYQNLKHAYSQIIKIYRKQVSKKVKVFKYFYGADSHKVLWSNTEIKMFSVIA